MSLDSCNAFLKAVALYNDGINHGSSYLIEPLPDAGSLDVALAQYFSAMSLYDVPPQPAEEWHIRYEELSGNWTRAIAPVVRRWFFEQDCSPKFDRLIMDNSVNQFMEYLRGVVGDARAFEVDVTPPMWYELVWEDVAIESPTGRWLLHFGFSD